MNELVREGDHFPLSTSLSEETMDEQTALPFGLRYVTTAPPASTVQIDFSKIGYDPVRQISVMACGDGSLLPAMKHTSTTTKTSTASHDRQGNDSDTDASGT